CTTDVIAGESSKKINARIHGRYMSEDALADPRAGGTLAAMDDTTLRLTPTDWYAWDMRVLDDAFFGGAMKTPGYVLPLDYGRTAPNDGTAKPQVLAENAERSSDHPMTRSPDGPMRKLLIAVHHPFDQWNAPAWFSERLRSEFAELNIVHLPDYKRLDAEIPDAEIVIAWSLRPEQIIAARNLRWIHSPAAAVHQLMFPELIHSEI